MPQGPHDPNPSLAALLQWQELERVWREAEEIAADKKGSYPFDQQGKERLLESIDALSPVIDSLAGDGRITADEAAVLRDSQQRMVRDIRGYRPVEMERATCYMVATPLREHSVAAFNARLALLSKVAASGMVHPEVLEKALPSIYRDMENLTGLYGAGHPSPQEGQNDWSGQEAQKTLEEIKKTLARAK